MIQIKIEKKDQQKLLNIKNIPKKNLFCCCFCFLCYVFKQTIILLKPSKMTSILFSSSRSSSKKHCFSSFCPLIFLPFSSSSEATLEKKRRKRSEAKDLSVFCFFHLISQDLFSLPFTLFAAKSLRSLFIKFISRQQKKKTAFFSLISFHFSSYSNRFALFLTALYSSSILLLFLKQTMRMIKQKSLPSITITQK